MKAIIVDDENKARQLLRAMLADLCPDVEVVADCDDLPSGVKAIKRHSPDIVFLDIEMPGHSGLELLDFFNDDEVHFNVIFTTAYDHYAIQAFKLSAVDYLLKPISPIELTDAVARAEKKNARDNTRIHMLRHQLGNDSKGKLAVPHLNGLRFLAHDDILYLKGERAYTNLYCKDGSTITASRNLKHFEEQLSGHRNFFRCHRSYIVNLGRITEYVRSDGGHLVLEGKVSISISPDRVDELMKRLG
jgi:two-component system LytT family response regulator